jgi:hypothetical protein
MNQRERTQAVDESDLLNRQTLIGLEGSNPSAPLNNKMEVARLVEDTLLKSAGA